MLVTNKAMKRGTAQVVLALGLWVGPGCTQFNRPIVGEFLAVIVAQDTPEIAVYRPSSDGRSLTLHTTYSKVQTSPITGCVRGNNAIVYLGSQSIGVITVTNANTVGRSEVFASGSSPNATAVLSHDSSNVYFTNDPDEVEMMKITNGSLPSSPTQTYATNVVSGEILSLDAGVSSLGTFIMAWTVAADYFLPIARNTSNGYLTNDSVQSVGSGRLIPIPSLGPHYFFASNAGGQSWVVNATPTSISVITSVSVGNAKFAVHPTQAWAYVDTGTTIQRVTLTTTSISTSTTTTVTGTGLGIDINSSGDRLIRLTTNSLQLYSIGADGAITLLSSNSISNASLSGLCLLNVTGR